MGELTLEQQKALARARARLRVQTQEPAPGKTDMQPPPPTTTANDASVYGLTDTMGFGFADEIGSGMGSVIEKVRGDDRPLGDIYTDILTRGRALDKKSQEEHPGDYFAGQAVGATVTLPIGGPAVKGAQTLFQGVKSGAKIGGAMGAAYGFGSGEGGLEQRVSSAGKGGLLGGAVGGAIPIAGKAAETVYGAVRPMFEPTKKYATRKMVEAAERAGTSIPQAMQEVNRMAKTNPEVVLADVLGKSGQRLSRAIVNKGGDGAERLTKSLGERQAGQGERITAAVSKQLGDPEGYYGNLDKTIQALKTNAKPIYEAAYNKPIDYAQFGGDLDEVFTRLPSRIQGQVIGAAKELMRLEGNESKQIMARIADDGTVTFERLPDVRQWDYIKRGIDKMIEGTEGQAAHGGMSQYGRVLSQVKNDLLDVLDKAVPEFKMARKVYSDDLSVKFALENGRKAINMDPELIVRNMRKMDTAAKTMFKAGYARAMNDQIGKVRYGNDAINRIWNTPSQQKRLKAVFGSKQEFAKFATFAKGEQKMGETWKSVSGNSTTTQQINDLIDAGNPVADFAANAATGGVRQAVMSAVMRWGRTIGGLTEARANQMADLLLSKGMTPDLLQAVQRKQLTNTQKAALARLINPAALLSVAGGSKAPQPAR